MSWETTYPNELNRSFEYMSYNAKHKSVASLDIWNKQQLFHIIKHECSFTILQQYVRKAVKKDLKFPFINEWTIPSTQLKLTNPEIFCAIEVLMKKEKLNVV